MFGSSFGSSGLGQAEDNVVELNPGPGGPVGGGEGAAGAEAAAQMAPPQAVVVELDRALQHARRAQHRLLDVPLGTIPTDQVSRLTDTFTTIQGNIADVVERAASVESEGQLLAINQDAQQVLEQVQQYVEAVEGTLTEHGATTPAAVPATGPLPANGTSIDPDNIALFGAAAVGIGVAGIVLWQMHKRKKDAERAERSEQRRRRRR